MLFRNPKGLYIFGREGSTDLPSIKVARSCVGANRAVAVCKAVFGDWLPWVKDEELLVLMGDAIFPEGGERLGFFERNFTARRI